MSPLIKLLGVMVNVSALVAFASVAETWKATGNELKALAVLLPIEIEATIDPGAEDFVPAVLATTTAVVAAPAPATVATVPAEPLVAAVVVVVVVAAPPVAVVVVVDAVVEVVVVEVLLN